MDIKGSMLELIGNTPMVYLDRFGEGLGARIAAKLELFNPYSVKDRPVLNMIETAEREGRIDGGTTIIEATSGNTGLALAFICAMKGYKLKICMSEIQSEERKQLLKLFGADLELTPAEFGTTGSKKRALELLEEIPNSFYIEQHSNPANTGAHIRTTAEELWRDTDGKMDIFVPALGTTGTAMGIAEALKKRKPSLKVIGTEPHIAPMISRGIFKPHRQAGTSPGFIPKLLNRENIDEIITVTEEQSFDTCRELVRKEGMLVGITSGMTAFVARELAKRPENEGKLIVCLFADTGQRYLSVRDLFDI
ncbi:MAG: cysteine synthase family protein [Candidatus Thermoplasmatota archaeon]|nr:cysteine synthase family protein [Candidatus Thermoplasmatota archaeon]